MIVTIQGDKRNVRYRLIGGEMGGGRRGRREEREEGGEGGGIRINSLSVKYVQCTCIVLTAQLNYIPPAHPPNHPLPVSFCETKHTVQFLDI